jgi:hypothetical protein
MKATFHRIQAIHVSQDRHWKDEPNEFHVLKIALETEEGQHEISLFSDDGPIVLVNPAVMDAN